MKKYKLVPQPDDSWEENPCWDCIFGKEDGECHAPEEIKNSKEYDDCGFSWSVPNYIFVEKGDNE